jgi:hypothetical protein
MTFDIPDAFEKALAYGRERGVNVKVMSYNRKLAPIEYIRDRNGRTRLRLHPTKRASSTYVSIEHTCPTTCPWKGAGCYVTASKFTAGMERQLSAGAREHGLAPEDVVSLEAALLDRVRFVPPQILRLHVGGDVVTQKNAVELGVAAGRWTARFNGAPVWTYTHRWREIEARAWGACAVLASVETLEDAEHALDRGYAPALVVPTHHSPKARKVGRLRVIPCPAETKSTTCFDCRLCAGDLASRGAAISFAAHGASARKVRLHLTQPKLDFGDA